MNLDASIAITQNFVPRAHLVGVLAFLKDKADQVSGFKKEVTDPYTMFVEGMKREYPELLDEAMGELERRAEGRKRKWDEAVATENGDGEAAGFSFGFGGDSDEEVP